MTERQLNKLWLNRYNPRLKSTERQVDTVTFSRIYFDDDACTLDFGPVLKSDLFLLSFSFLIDSDVVPTVTLSVTENGFADLTDLPVALSMRDTYWFNGVRLLQPKTDTQESLQIKFLITGIAKGTVKLYESGSDVYVVSSRVLPASTFVNYRKITATI